jgi:two-component system chemotaxis response regulator CheB
VEHVNNIARVLVVDDSALMRKLIPLILKADLGIDVVGTAMDGDFALKKIPDLRPTVITLDVDMPRMDGLTTLHSIVKDFGIPVILVSSLTRDRAEITLKGLELGAFDFVPKPEGAISEHIGAISRELIDKVKAAHHARPMNIKTALSPEPKNTRQKPPLPYYSRASGAVAIGISTGGPQALTRILPRIGADFPYGILIVQHMPEGFTELFAKRLNDICSIRVKEAEEGDYVQPGTALLAPGGWHLKARGSLMGATAAISRTAEVSGHRPSATVLFDSVAEVFGPKAIGLIMTGMGDDGVEGLRRIKEKGGITIAQDASTSLIYGMPKVAFEKGYAGMVLGLDGIVPALLELTQVGTRDKHILTREEIHTLDEEVTHDKIYDSR